MYLVIGASGYLGRYIINNILDNTSAHVVATFSSKEPFFQNERINWKKLDVCNIDEVCSLHSEMEKDVNIIYLAAYHNPDKVEENPQLAWEINIIALANFVNIFRKVKSFYYVSTDAVYGEGTKERKFSETDNLIPVNLYGRHKVLGEQITLAKGFNVVRLPFMLGPSLVDCKKHFFDNIKRDLENNKTIEMFADSYRSTLSFNQSALHLVKLIEKYGACHEKVINIAGDSALSKYEVALMVVDKYGLSKALVKPISIHDKNDIFKAKRAVSTVMDNCKIKKLLKLNNIKLDF
jgi:dTDP-4-dehydrorhamnose reductase